MSEEVSVTVAENENGPYGQTVNAGKHVLAADEPPELGGKDTGPSPYEYLLAALGACTSMTVRMYADRKEIPLEHVNVMLRHRKEKVETGEGDTRHTVMVDCIERDIELTGDLDEAMRNRLIEIANKCPVHRTLTSGDIRVNTREVKTAEAL